MLWSEADAQPIDSSRIRYTPQSLFSLLSWVFGMPNTEEASNGYRQCRSSCSMKEEEICEATVWTLWGSAMDD
ncbi:MULTISPECIES: hypothetical protein [unclassified Variovorax]|uniref:hypothetical protein n=1 Tax=unclassified Variovorax TaxID=663243 RepID=UPI003F4569AA